MHLDQTLTDLIKIAYPFIVIISIVIILIAIVDGYQEDHQKYLKYFRRVKTEFHVKHNAKKGGYIGAIIAYYVNDKTKEEKQLIDFQTPKRNSRQYCEFDAREWIEKTAYKYTVKGL